MNETLCVLTTAVKKEEEGAVIDANGQNRGTPVYSVRNGEDDTHG